MGRPPLILTGQIDRSKLMKRIQASAAKARFAELLDEVERGETVVITRHGKPIARLVPDQAGRREEIRRVLDEIKEMRKHAPRATIQEILAWRDEGRR
jgi:prevent-host-death family protein